MEATMATGAREAKPSWFARMVARAMSRDLRAFVVPGEDVARARGLDIEAAGLRTSATPRHANVLVIVGELPPGLKRAAAVAYAQMPRPRAILAVGAGDLSPLPEPEVRTASEQENLARGAKELGGLFSENAFRGEASDFDAEAVRTRTEYTCAMHPEIVRSEPESCPICGMDLVPRESVGEEMKHDDGHESYEGSAGAGEEVGDPKLDLDTEHAGHEGMDYGDGSQHEDHDPAFHGETGEMDHRRHEEHGGMDHMDHGDMDFMSMVEMTKDLPRSRDGLPMEWVGVPFGPLFPGLPGGLSLSLTLDGDAVAEAEATSIVGVRSLEGQTGPAESFVERMARLDPLSPIAYRVLALRALEDAVGAIPDERTMLARMGAIERERAASHLGWLAGLGRLLGHRRLARRAGKLQLALLRAEEVGELAELRVQASKFVNGVRRTHSLKRRLGGVGVLPEGVDVSGPVARARGVRTDVRIGEIAYRNLGFKVVVGEGDDALSRTYVRLEEVERSLEFAAAGSVSLSPPVVDPGLTARGEATAETPRGAVNIRISLDDGVMSVLELSTPSTAHLALVGGMADDRELAEFLVGVVSLDVSPWEVTR